MRWVAVGVCLLAALAALPMAAFPLDVLINGRTGCTPASEGQIYGWAFVGVGLPVAAIGVTGFALDRAIRRRPVAPLAAVAVGLVPASLLMAIGVSAMNSC
jgi:hypothetical protein